MRTVLLQTSGWLARMSSMFDTYQAPKSGAQFGCSEYASGATIQETCGRLPLETSELNWSNNVPLTSTCVPVLAQSARGLPGGAFWYWWKYRSELSP